MESKPAKRSKRPKNINSIKNYLDKNQFYAVCFSDCVMFTGYEIELKQAKRLIKWLQRACEYLEQNNEK